MGEEDALPSVRNLSLDYQRRLATSLTVTSEFDLYRPEKDPWPPGATEYSVSFSVSWFRPEAKEAPDGDAQILGELSRDAADADGYVTARVGSANLIVADIYERSLFEALDARSGDLAHIGGAILDIGSGELAAELLRIVDGVGQNLLIVNTVQIDEPFRGLSFGLIGTGLLLQHLCKSSGGVAALYPMKPGAQDEDRDTSYARLSAYWSRLGFELFQDNVHVLDLATVTLDRKMHDLLA
ncbi:hypothetical protein GCM10022223_37040 [Kineosporia mesophila]|uniref:Uncharacterized protein n=1 Tax=Kineosporia mesophila TaxID=566012 RepID=A0ABP6ZRJ1_9ACTN|nr:hypothetical protein [Kineosporia mesophila]MCD5349870.1 hypothetical protein [Kineosporia mesophila]